MQSIVEGRRLVPQAPASLLQATITFDTRSVGKCSDTEVSVTLSNRDNLAFCSGHVGGDQEWPEMSTVSVTIPILESVDWDTCSKGTVQVRTARGHPMSWGFNLTLFLEFENGAWWQVTWHEATLEGAEPTFRGTWN